MYISQKPFFTAGHGLYQKRNNKERGLTPLRSQGSPLRSDPFGTIALDFIHPLVKKEASWLSPKARTFHY
jgi:hypothetical protein